MPAETQAQAAAASQASVSDRDFQRFQALIHREAGIWLSPVKKALLVGRLSRRLRALALRSWADYYEAVVADPAERVRMIDCICTNETHFFREPRHFEFLEERLFPAWRAEAEEGCRPRRIRAWSAACSTGEEPFSLAMSLLAAFPSGWDLEVLATDLSTRVLERARAAVWPMERASQIPDRHRKAFMLRGFGSRQGAMKAGPEIRALVRFSRLNLVGEDWPPPGAFDLVFCRNVLIYFDRPTKERVVGRLVERLAPGGHLFLGHAESLAGFTIRVRAVMPTVYVPIGPARAAPAERP